MAGGSPRSSPPRTADAVPFPFPYQKRLLSAEAADLPTKQAAGTHVLVTQRLPLKRAAMNHGGLIASAAGPVEGIRVNAGQRSSGGPLAPISHLS